MTDSAATPAGDEFEAVLAEHAPHLLKDWRATLRLYRIPDFLRARADEIERKAKRPSGSDVRPEATND